jgi:hypothetical protein
MDYLFGKCWDTDEACGYESIDVDGCSWWNGCFWWNKDKLKVVEMEAPRLRARACDGWCCWADDVDAGGYDYSATMKAHDGVDHMWIQCVEEDGNIVMRAVYADQGEMTVQVGDYIALSGYGLRKWFKVKVESISRGDEPEFRFRVSFAVDGSWEKCQFLAARYGLGLLTVQWGKKEAKTRLGWMFLRPTSEAGGGLLRTAESIFGMN